MPTLVYRDAYLSINSVVLSAFVQELTLNYESETVDDTTMGANTRSSRGALKNWSVSATLLQDFAASQVDATLFPLVGTTFPIEIRPTSAAVGTANPKYTANAMLSSYTPMTGTVGDMLSITIELVPSKGASGGVTAADLARATT